MDITAYVDGSGNIVSTNNSTGANPMSYVSYVYNTDLNPWGVEYLDQSATITYAPMYVAEYQVCLVATVLGTNDDCASICAPLTYTKGMMNLQISAGLQDLSGPNNISVYPIPAQNVLHILSNDLGEEEEFRVFDLLGQEKTIELNYNENITLIDLSSFSSGIYPLKSVNKNTSKSSIVRFVVE